MSVIKKTGLLLLSEIIAKGIAFLLIPLYSFLISPKDFGIVAILNIFFIGFHMLISFSFKNTFEKYFFEQGGFDLRKLFSNILLLQIISLGLGSVFFFVFKNKLEIFLGISNPDYLLYTYITAMFGIFLPIINSYLICTGNAKRVGIYSISISLFRSLSALGLVFYLEDKILAILLSNLIEHTIGFGLSYNYYRKRVNLQFMNIGLIKEMGGYSIMNFPTIFSNFFIKFSDRIMIQFMLGFQSLGIYSMGTRLVNIPGQFISTINQNFTPQIFKSISENDRISFNKLNRLFLVAIFVLLFGLITFSNEIFLLIGPDYKESFTIFILLSFTSYVNGYNLIIQPAMTYFKDYVKYKSIIFISIGVLNIILNLIVIPIYGINGAALVTALSYSLSIPFSYYYSKKAFHENYFLKWFFASSILLAMMGFYTISIFEFSMFSIIVKIILFIAFGTIFVNRLVDVQKLLSKTKKFIIKRK